MNHMKASFTSNARGWLHKKYFFCKLQSQLQESEAHYSALYPDNIHTSTDGLIVVSEKNETPLFYFWEENGGGILKGEISGKN